MGFFYTVYGVYSLGSLTRTTTHDYTHVPSHVFLLHPKSSWSNSYGRHSGITCVFGNLLFPSSTTLSLMGKYCFIVALVTVTVTVSVTVVVIVTVMLS